MFGNGTETALQVCPLVSDDHVQTESFAGCHVTLLDYERSGYAPATPNGPSWFFIQSRQSAADEFADPASEARLGLASEAVVGPHPSSSPSNGPTLVMSERLGWWLDAAHC